MIEKSENCPSCGEVKGWLYDAQICSVCHHPDHTKGDVKFVKKTLVRRLCSYCDQPAFYKNSYLDEGQHGARLNPKSAAFGRDDVSWCSDYDDYCCPFCHQENLTDNVPSGLEWNTTMQADRFPRLFLVWDEEEIDSDPMPPQTVREAEHRPGVRGREGS